MYSHLKKEFNVTKYTNIKHVEAEKAIKFLESLSYDDFTPFEIRETPKQKEIIALEKKSDWKHYNVDVSIKSKKL